MSDQPVEIEQPSPDGSASNDASAGAPAGGSLRERIVHITSTINGNEYVSGLLWEKLASTRGIESLLRMHGAKLGLDAAALWQSSGAVQAGYGAIDRGAVSSKRSFAVAAAPHLGSDTLACAALADDVYAVIATRGGAIVPGSDVAGSFDFIHSVYASLVEDALRLNRAFVRRIAPEEIDATAEHEDLVAAIAKAPLVPLIKALLPVKKREFSKGKRIAAAVMVALVAGGAFMGHRHNEAVAEAKAAAERAKAAAMAMAKMKEAQKPPVDAWSNSPTAASLIASCSGQMSKLPVAVGGWIITSASCGFGHMEAVYHRQGTATNQDLLSAMQSRLGVVPTFKAGTDDAGISVGFAAPPTSDEHLVQEDPASSRFISHFQSIGVPAPLTAAPPPVVPQNGPPPPPLPWKTLTFAVSGTAVTPINTAHHPSLLFTGLDLPGLRVDSISFARTDAPPFLQWTVSGHLYAL